MRKKKSSVTAAGIAIARAVESEKPAGERICYDPYARRFVPAWMYSFLGFFIKSGYADLRGPGVNAFLMARERAIDDVLQDFLGDGLQQLVILGAGYDTRAYRFDLAGRVKVFEVDQPATQAVKLEKLRGIFGEVPKHVVYVAVDFNTQTLSDSLLGCGYDPELISLFIWQGVTMYLTPAGVDHTLAFIATHAAAGSAVVFDYVYQAVLDGTEKQSEISSMQRYRYMTGEAPTFGIAEGSAEGFLEARGFRQVDNVTADDLQAAYFRGKNAGRTIARGYGIVTAWV